ncbi:hypothetical protein BRADI_3g21094v3 [Brachypodium distachyon]|uniref:Transposase (putative) gypsy type domain-containing protein n=1 Tax=Brachypodium distachyon TaxID=15368 RepID=A0A2K2CYK5_BRADI|nr:hypothetical protein BRADI_3g21094v3 [Brachypodium distachyon]
MGKTKTAGSKTDAVKGDAGKGVVPWPVVADNRVKILELQDEGLLPGGPDGVRFPAKEEYPRPLLAYGLQLHDLPPNSYLHVTCFITLCECFLGVIPHWGLWKRIFTIKGQKADVVGSVNFQQRESVQGWRSKWFFVHSDAPGADQSLPAFSIKKKTKKTAAWSHELTPAEESEATPLMAKMHSLMGQRLTGVHLLALFLKMRIQPLQARVHPMWSFEGPGDPTRVNAEELSLNKLESRVRRLTTLIDATPGKIDSPVVPYGLDRPREERLEDPLSQPPPTGEEELADESSESPEQASDSETEEVALETGRKRSRESNPSLITSRRVSRVHPLQPHLLLLQPKRPIQAAQRLFADLAFLAESPRPGSSVASGDQPTTQGIEPTGSDPKALGPSIVVETFEPQVAMPEAPSPESTKKLEAEKRLAQEASDALLAKEAEKEKTRAARLQGVIGSLAGLLPLSESSLDTVIDVVTSVYSGADWSPGSLPGAHRLGKNWRPSWRLSWGAWIHQAFWPLEEVPQELSKLTRELGQDSVSQELMYRQLVRGAKIALAFVRVQYPRLDLSRISELPGDPGDEIDLRPHFNAVYEQAARIIGWCYWKEEDLIARQRQPPSP